ncbi:peptidylprolyl isomerase [Sandaracinus amylolyticus]|uniref:Peptidyl-prolyl cis-trans isomerase PpiD n=1 Tax=Sandaracinus amylolyticus TaxID=927083 RepID=A0A0F6SG12_9BACT|nr:peptidyl-prolyl cis-trans isomerase [Sandaracinus amylolyticus]AKF07889.1 Peptidyl-prolyl cis-trans isomerase PpiD [Sandaracinus amylolyticus]
MRRARSVVVACLVSLALACGGETAAPDAGARRAVAPSARVSGTVVSTVDGAPITLEEVEEVARETGLAPQDALRRLQEERVLAAHAEAAGLGDDDEVQDAVRRASVQALLEARVEAEITPASIPAEQVAARMEAQRARWARPERRRSTHVVARLAPDAPPEADAAAERFARRAIERMSAAEDARAEAHVIGEEDHAGRTYEVLVEDLPPVTREGQLVPEYLDALFSRAEPGVVAQPLRTTFGWHAIVLTEVMPPWEAPRDEVVSAMRQELAVEARAARLEELARELASRTPVERDEAAIDRAITIDLEAMERGGASP